MAHTAYAITGRINREALNAELVMAGCGSGTSIGTDKRGQLVIRVMDYASHLLPEIQAVLAAHDPDAPMPAPMSDSEEHAVRVDRALARATLTTGDRFMLLANLEQWLTTTDGRDLSDSDVQSVKAGLRSTPSQQTVRSLATRVRARIESRVQSERVTRRP